MQRRRRDRKRSNCKAAIEAVVVPRPKNWQRVVSTLWMTESEFMVETCDSMKNFNVTRRSCSLYKLCGCPIADVSVCDGIDWLSLQANYSRYSPAGSTVFEHFSVLDPCGQTNEEPNTNCQCRHFISQAAVFLMTEWAEILNWLKPLLSNGTNVLSHCWPEKVWPQAEWRVSCTALSFRVHLVPIRDIERRSLNHGHPMND